MEIEYKIGRFGKCETKCPNDPSSHLHKGACVASIACQECDYYGSGDIKKFGKQFIDCNFDKAKP